MEYFKLGVSGEGYTFFLPDTYKKSERIIGTGIKRTLSGMAKRDIITTKKTFELRFSYIDELECVNLYAQFENNVKLGKSLTFIDDENTYSVIWGGEDFGLSDREQHHDIYWSGTIVLEEV